MTEHGCPATERTEEEGEQREDGRPFISTEDPEKGKGKRK